MSVNVEETPIYPLLEDSPDGLRVSDILPDNVTCYEHTEHHLWIYVLQIMVYLKIVL